jgi:hypothetical protein
VLLYDVTSTYFEGLAQANRQAQRGYSRDHRSDCKQVCTRWWSPSTAAPYLGGVSTDQFGVADLDKAIA